MILPDLAELISFAGMAREAALPLARVAQGSLQGTHLSAHRGRGLEFQEVRPYVAGEDVRTIDWRVTARRGRPHTKLFREERERPLWLVADLDPGMFFGTRRQTKSAVVVRACAFLAWVAFQMGDRVGAVIATGQEPRILPPRARERGVAELLGSLLDGQPTAPSPPTADNLTKALKRLGHLVHPGSAVMVLSDFASLDEECAALWSGVAARNESRLLWVTDDLEEQGLPSGRYRVGVPSRSFVVDADRLRPAWQRAWQEREVRINRLAQQSGTALVRLRTSESVPEALRTSMQAWRFAA